MSLLSVRFVTAPSRSFVVTRVFPAAEASLATAFAKVDTNSDGLVDKDEFTAWWTSFHAMRRVFQDIDADKSGFVQ